MNVAAIEKLMADSNLEVEDDASSSVDEAVELFDEAAEALEPAVARAKRIGQP